MPSTITIRRALISVYDKTGIVDFARALHDEFGIEIISTGGTAKTLTDAGIPVTLVETLTGFGEMLDGRVKTLHPNIHAAILADRDNPEHMRQLEAAGIKPIDMVVVNLYPFEKTVADPNCTFEQAIEMIDIGGVALLRAAGKNCRHVLVVSTVAGLESALEALWSEDVTSDKRRIGGSPNAFFDVGLGAQDAFYNVSAYDAAIATWLSTRVPGGFMPAFRTIYGRKVDQLRYGENAHQDGEALQVVDGVGFDLTIADSTWCDTQPILSYNNYVDADAALGLCAELTRAAGLNILWHRSSTGELWHGSLTRAKPVGKPVTQEQWSRRNLPHLQVPSSTYFVTFRVLRGTLSPPERDAVLAACIHWHGRKMTLHCATVMPDHVHLLFTPHELAPGAFFSLAEILHSIKPFAANQINRIRGTSGAIWLDEYFDRLVRDENEFVEKWEYIEANPLTARLIERLPYKWFWRSETGFGERVVGAHGSETRATAHRSETGATVESAGTDARAKKDGCATVTFVKHTNACGVGVADDAIEAYRRAYLGDPNAAMGGILACNFAIDAEFATVVMETYDRFGKPLKDAGAAQAPGGFFLEVWLAPSFDDEAVTIIRGSAEATPQRPNPPRKKWGENVRLLAVGDMAAAPDPNELLYRSIAGGMLVQTPDVLGLNEEQWKVVTQRAPSEAEMADLRLAWLICKHTKSNAITLVQDGMLIGNGAGQMSRVMSCRVATWLARENGHLGDRPPAGLKSVTQEVQSRRHVPHIERPEVTQFVTFRLREGELTAAERDIVLAACRFWHGEKMTLHAVGVMPDHVHLILTPVEATTGRWVPLGEIIKSIKSYSASQINMARGRKGPLWQDESFDRIIRDERDFFEKLEYVQMNPVTAGLVQDVEAYRWFWKSELGWGEWVVGDRPEAGPPFAAGPPSAKGPVAASDAFFPFRDGPEILIEAGVTAIIQPGGSKRDDDTIAACNERGVAMIFTGTRHFRH